MSARPIRFVEPLRIADARNAHQRVRINRDLAVHKSDVDLGDDLANVVCCEDTATGVRTITQKGHINLVETLPEDIAAMCLKDRRGRSGRGRVETLDVMAGATSVGVEIERFSPRL